MKRWWTFIWERFDPRSHLPMLALFAAANAAVGARALGRPLQWGLLAGSFALTLAYFFRLRLFDEMKDLEVDRSVNPDRPLARGLLQVFEVRLAVALLIVFEGLLAWRLGPAVLLGQLFALLYSLLMFEEFFVGRWLRPKLTTYAVTHTLSSAFIGAVSATAQSGRPFWNFNRPLLLLLPFNWAVFNFFEFSRKTFSTVEERPSVESYSSLFGPMGALFLSLTQVFAALYVARQINGQFSLASLGAGAVFIAASVLYIGGRASLYRALSALVILGLYLGLL